MNAKSILNSALCLILAGGIGAATLHPATADAKEPKKGKKAAPAPLPPEGQELDVKAADLTKVTYKGPAKTQSFAQTGPKTWRSAGVTYDEVERDEFSVYLIRVKTDNERVVIDLHTRQVSFFTGPLENGPAASYPLLSASSEKTK